MGLKLGDIRRADCKKCSKETSHAAGIYLSKKNTEASFYLICTLFLNKIHLTRLPLIQEELFKRILD